MFCLNDKTGIFSALVTFFRRSFALFLCWSCLHQEPLQTGGFSALQALELVVSPLHLPPHTHILPLVPCFLGHLPVFRIFNMFRGYYFCNSELFVRSLICPSFIGLTTSCLSLLFIIIFGLFSLFLVPCSDLWYFDLEVIVLCFTIDFRSVSV